MNQQTELCQTDRENSMKKITYSLLLISLITISCNLGNDDHEKKDEYYGEPVFSPKPYRIGMTAEPNYVMKDSVVTLTTTVFPNYTGKGRISIHVDVSALEYPKDGSIIQNENGIFYQNEVHFTANQPFTQIHKIRIGDYISLYDEWCGPVVFVNFDSVYVADSLKYYGVQSEELRKFMPLDYFIADGYLSDCIPVKK